MTEAVDTEREELKKHERPRSKLVVRPSDAPPGPAASLDLSRMHLLRDYAENFSALSLGLSDRRLDARARWNRSKLVLSEALEYSEKAQPSLASRLGLGRAAWPLGQGRALAPGERIPPPSIPEKWLEDPGASGLREAVRDEQEAREALERIERQHEKAGQRAGAARQLLRRCEEFAGRASGSGAPSTVSAVPRALRSGPAMTLVDLYTKVERSCSRRAELRAQRTKIERTPASLEVATDRIGEFIEQRAPEPGSMAFRFVGPEASSNDAAGTTLGMFDGPGRGIEPRDVMRAFAFLWPERLREALVADAKAAIDAAGGGLSVSARAEALAVIDAELLALEVEEEVAIRESEASGYEGLDRRGDAEPAVVLARDPAALLKAA